MVALFASSLGIELRLVGIPCRGVPEGLRQLDMLADGWIAPSSSVVRISSDSCYMESFLAPF